jgi:hypothetical protein
MNMSKVYVVINEQHSLFPEQEKILDAKFPKWEFYKIPAEGLTLDEQRLAVKELKENIVVFASPVPFLMKELAYIAGFADPANCENANGLLVGYGTQVLVFHNDKRIKRELPGGKIISVVAETGWQLV